MCFHEKSTRLWSAGGQQDKSSNIYIRILVPPSQATRSWGVNSPLMDSRTSEVKWIASCVSLKTAH